MSERALVIQVQEEQTIPGFVQTLKDCTQKDIEVVCDWDSMPTDVSPAKVAGGLVSQLSMFTQWVTHLQQQNKTDYLQFIAENVKTVKASVAESDSVAAKAVEIDDEAGLVHIVAPLRRDQTQYVHLLDLYAVAHHFLLKVLLKSEKERKEMMLKEILLMDRLKKDGDLRVLLQALEHEAFYTPNELVSKAIEASREALFAGSFAGVKPAEDEVFVKGYPVIKINKFEMEQERLILITTKAFYTVCYEYAKGEPKLTGSVHCNPLHAIKSIQFGEIAAAKGKGVAGAVAGAMAKVRYGLAVKFDPALAALSPEQTDGLFFMPLPEEDEIEAEQGILPEIAYALAAISTNVKGHHHPIFPAHVNVHKKAAPLGFVGAVYNGLKLGLQKKDGAPASPAAAAPAADGDAAKADEAETAAKPEEKDGEADDAE